jgi:hypothetical protein
MYSADVFISLAPETSVRTGARRSTCLRDIVRTVAKAGRLYRGHVVAYNQGERI